MRPLLRKLWLAGAVLVIAFAAISAAVRLALPHIDRYHAFIERSLTASLAQPVKIGVVSADWYRLGPRLALSDVAIGDDPASTIRLAAVQVDINLPLSLLKASLQVDDFTVSGLRLFVTPGPAGEVRVAGAVIDAADTGDGGLIAWMLAQRRLSVKDSEVVWRRPGDSDIVFSEVAAELRSQHDRHVLHGSVALPASLGARLSFAADLKGMPNDADWRMQTYVEADDLQLAGWLSELGLGGVQVTDGAVKVRAWGDWGAGVGGVIDGELRASGLRITSAAPAEGRNDEPVSIDSASGRFSWRRQAGNWRIDVADLVWSRPDQAVSPQQLAVVRDAEAIAIAVDRLEVNDVIRLFALSGSGDERLRAAAVGFSPQGTVRDVGLRVGPDGHFALDAMLDQIRSRPWGRYPGLTGVSGHLQLENDRGSLELQSSGPVQVSSDLFRAPLVIATATGRASWARDEAGWHVLVPELSIDNEDAAVQAWGHVDLPAADDGPFVALFTRFEAHSVKHLSRYLPTGIMRPNAIDWLDHAIVDGSVANGELTLAGRLREFPFDGHEGVFRVGFDVHDGALDYAPGWPRLAEIEAQLLFEGRRMSLQGTHGTSFASAIRGAEVGIDDMTAKPPILRIAGTVGGETRDGVRFLTETPLAARFGSFLKDVKASGSSRLDLRLALPLGEGSSDIDGRMDFDDSGLDIANGALTIEHVKGPLHFSNAGVDARRIRALVTGLPAIIRVRPERSDAGTSTVVEASGRVGTAGLAHWLPDEVSQWFAGETAWKARLFIPDAKTESNATRLNVESDLQGLEIKLPAPLTKPAEAVWPFRLEVRLPRAADRPIRVSVGNRIAAALILDDQSRIERGEIRLGDDAAVLPDRSGLRIAGTTDHLDADGWRRLLQPADSAAPAAKLREIDLTSERLNAFGRELHGLRIRAHPEDAGAWTVELDGLEVAGTLSVPPGEGSEWRADLKRLYLDKPQDVDARDKPVDPRSLPALSVQCDDFHYGSTNFGRLSLRASRRPQGMTLDELVLASDAMRIEAKGDWTAEGDTQVSAFDIRFASSDFGRALTALGYAGTIGGGKADAVVRATWSGGPTAFALERMDGSLDLEVADGRLLEVEPGAGRIFGLISLQALPRRLTLDFSDIFGKGFGFDRIAGHFDIHDGIAKTSDLTMTGPAARITASGDIKLAERQYDQTVVVTPNVSSGLPVAGAVAGGLSAGALTGGLGVGAAVFLMERALHNGIDRMTRVRYRVVGPWSNPNIERLQDSVESGTKERFEGDASPKEGVAPIQGEQRD